LLFQILNLYRYDEVNRIVTIIGAAAARSAAQAGEGEGPGL
jgi:hypothetical protein